MTDRLNQIDPRWNEVLEPFLKLDYPSALAVARAYRDNIDSDLRSKLKPYHYSNIHNNIAESAYRVLTAEKSSTESPRQEEWNEFFNSLENYVKTNEIAAREEPEEKWWRDPRFPTKLLSHALDLLLRYRPDQLQQVEQWVARFMGVWGAELTLDVLLKAIHDERINVLRQGYIANIQTLAAIYLRLTQGLPPDIYRHPRSLVMDILSDLTYFTGGDRAEMEALQWVEQALAINPEDRFAQQRRKDILNRKVVMDQIHRFNHDANTAIAGLISNLRSLEGLPLPDPARAIVEKMRLGLNRIHGVHRFVQKQQAEFQIIVPRREIDRLTVAYAQVRFEVTGGEDGATLETDLDYFQIVLETLIRNALEAFERRQIPLGERLIQIALDLSHKRLVFRDNAGGIDPGLKGRIFEPYVSSKDIKQATGLGLSSARRIMEDLLKGHIDLTDPQPSSGAEFMIQF